MNLGMIRNFALAGLASLAPAALAVTYTTIDFPGATATDANGINSSGEIVGAYADGGGGRKRPAIRPIRAVSESRPPSCIARIWSRPSCPK